MRRLFAVSASKTQQAGAGKPTILSQSNLVAQYSTVIICNGCASHATPGRAQKIKKDMTGMIKRWQDAALDEHLKQYETMECCRCGEVKYIDELINTGIESICEKCQLKTQSI
jgi:hypothetical protein